MGSCAAKVSYGVSGSAGLRRDSVQRRLTNPNRVAAPGSADSLLSTLVLLGCVREAHTIFALDIKRVPFPPEATGYSQVAKLSFASTT